MKNEYKTICSKLRLAKKKISFGFLMVLFISSCQSVHTTHYSDQSRIQHARELLKSEYSNSPVAQFEGDNNMGLYIDQYLQTKNSKMNSVSLTENILKLSKQYQYDPVFILAVIQTESQFRPHIVGSFGEIGLMQIKPSTAEWICEKVGFPWKGAQALKDPVYNIQIGALYFKYLKKSLKSKSAHYINAYNMGMGNLARLPASSKISHPYYSKVLKNYIDIYQELQLLKKT